MPRSVFWRNQPITGRRARTILGKIRSRGVSWLRGRIAKEFRAPETTEGIYVRLLAVWIYGALLSLLSPLLVLARLIFRLPRDTLYYFYDLDVSPITYDVADWLVLAELERRRRGLGQVYVVVVPGRQDGLRDEGADYEKVVDRASRWWRLHHLVVPLLSLLPTCGGYAICRDRRQATLLRMLVARHVYPPTYWPAFPLSLFRRPILDAARRGVAVFPLFKSPAQSLRYVRRWLDARAKDRKVVTITIRTYGIDASRNSNLAAWAAFAAGLDSRRFLPVFVLDIETAMDPVPEALGDFEVFREAPWNLALRSALYESAYLNLGIVHGPTELLWYNDRCRYVIFFPSVETRQTTADFVAANGFVAGESLPFATPFQSWVWAPDELETIRREFARMCATIEASAAAGAP